MARRSRLDSQPSAEVFKCKYHGFAYVRGDGETMPGLAKVRQAYELLRTPKAARKAHPLFARGFDTLLDLQISERALYVSLQLSAGQDRRVIVMEHGIHKIAFVIHLGKSLCFVARQHYNQEQATYKCHSFELSSEALAKECCNQLSVTCSMVYKKLRKTLRAVKRRSLLHDDPAGRQPAPAPTVPAANGATSDAAEVETRLDLLEAELAKALEKTNSAADLRDKLRSVLKESDLDDEDGPPPYEDEYEWYDQEISDKFAELALTLDSFDDYDETVVAAREDERMAVGGVAAPGGGDGGDGEGYERLVNGMRLDDIFPGEREYADIMLDMDYFSVVGSCI